MTTEPAARRQLPLAALITTPMLLSLAPLWAGKLTCSWDEQRLLVDRAGRVVDAFCAWCTGWVEEYVVVADRLLVMARVSEEVGRLTHGYRQDLDEMSSRLSPGDKPGEEKTRSKVTTARHANPILTENLSSPRDLDRWSFGARPPTLGGAQPPSNSPFGGRTIA